MFSGSTGLFRLFNDLMGGQASWLLPAALLALVGRSLGYRRAPRTDRQGVNPAMGRVAAGHRNRVQLWSGRDPHLLHGRARSGDRGAGRDRRCAPVAGSRLRLARGCSRPWSSRSQRLGVRAACTHAFLASLAAHRDCDRGRPGGDRPADRAAPAPARAALDAGRRGARCDRDARQARLRYSAETINTPHTGSIPSAGPALSASAGGGPTGGGPPGATTGAGGTHAGFPGGASGRGAFPGATGGLAGSSGAHGGDGGRGSRSGAAPPHSITSCWRRLSVMPRITAGSRPPSVRRRRPASSWPPAASP